MEACDCCGRRVDERSMVMVKVPVMVLKDLKGNQYYFVCQACDGQYSKQELIEKLIELHGVQSGEGS